MKKRITITILFVLLFLVIGGIWHSSRNILVVENISGKIVHQVTITVCGESYQLEQLPPDERRRVVFDVKGDSGFQVDVSFDDGTKVSGSFGYVTGGAGAYNNKAKVKIYSERIEGIQE